MTKGGGDDAPKERSARSRPPPALQQAMSAAKSHSGSSRRQLLQNDPRFSPTVYHGTVVKQNVEKNYAFLSELAKADEDRRRKQIRALRQEQNLRERERGGGGGGEAPVINHGVDHDEDDDDDDGDEHLKALPDEERVRIGLMRDSELEQEIANWKKASNRHKMRLGEQRAQEQRSAAKRKWAQSQFGAVKAGKQRQPFFLNEKRMKHQVMKEQLKSAAETGGRQGEMAFVERKLKKRFAANVKHLAPKK